MLKEYTFSFDATRTILLAENIEQAEAIYLGFMSGPITKVDGALMYQWDSTFSEEIRVHEKQLSVGIVSHESH